MIAVDTCSFVSFLQGQKTSGSVLTEDYLRAGVLCFPPMVITELFSSPTLTDEDKSIIGTLPVLPLKPDFWERAGRLRAELLKSKMSPATLDCLIAMACIENKTGLISDDKGFTRFVSFGLKLAV